MTFSIHRCYCSPGLSQGKQQTPHFYCTSTGGIHSFHICWAPTDVIVTWDGSDASSGKQYLLFSSMGTTNCQTVSKVHRSKHIRTKGWADQLFVFWVALELRTLLFFCFLFYPWKSLSHPQTGQQAKSKNCVSNMTLLMEVTDNQAINLYIINCIEWKRKALNWR